MYVDIEHKTYGYEPSVTDASKPKKQIPYILESNPHPFFTVSEG